MADQFSGLDMRVNRMRKIVHTCDLQHACRFAHEKDWASYCSSVACSMACTIAQLDCLQLHFLALHWPPMACTSTSNKNGYLAVYCLL